MKYPGSEVVPCKCSKTGSNYESLGRGRECTDINWWSVVPVEFHHY